jgi:hypothetical protein
MTTLTWVNPTTRLDGTPYNGASENAGYEISIDDQPAVSVPLQWGTSFELNSLALYSELKHGTHKVELIAVDKGGRRSPESAPTTFQTYSPPSAPTNLAATG